MISDKRRRMEGRRGGGRRKVTEVGRRKKEGWRHIGRKTKEGGRLGREETLVTGRNFSFNPTM